MIPWQQAPQHLQEMLARSKVIPYRLDDGGNYVFGREYNWAPIVFIELANERADGYFITFEGSAIFQERFPHSFPPGGVLPYCVLELDLRAIQVGYDDEPKKIQRRHNWAEEGF